MKFLFLEFMKLLSQFPFPGHWGTPSFIVKPDSSWVLIGSTGPCLNMFSIPIIVYFCSEIPFSWNICPTISFKISSILFLAKGLCKFFKEQSIFFLYASLCSFLLLTYICICPLPTRTHTRTQQNVASRREVLCLTVVFTLTQCSEYSKSSMHL